MDSDMGVLQNFHLLQNIFLSFLPEHLRNVKISLVRKLDLVHRLEFVDS